jgi:CheY-like chemotaxis protein
MEQAITMPQHTVLVVDDEPLLRFELVDMLEEKGFTVLDASDADEAIECMAAHPEIGAVLTDIEMPGSMDGIKLVHYIRNRWPPTALFVISARKPSDDQVLPEHTGFYGKPLDSRRLLRDLSAALSH